MQYYKNYLDNEQLNTLDYGILEVIDNKYYVNNNELINNRAIYGDEVYILNNEIVGIKKRFSSNIVGILCLTSKIKYGSIKDKNYYLFKPTNKSFPNFYVPYKNTNKNVNIYVIINFHSWDISNKMPYGILVEVIGFIGNKESEFEHLRNYFNIRNNTWKIDNKKMEHDNKIINELQNIKEDYEVFSIDPLGSKDIDDAFHFSKMENNFCEIGVHIASPFIFFKDEVLNILNRVSTVYAPERKYNMLPNSYADDMVSLIEKQNRFALSVIFKLRNNKLESYEIKETIVKNIKNYDYDTFDKIWNKNKNLSDFMDISKIFFNDFSSITSFDSFDSHKLVENWMIYTNKIVAKYLIDKKIDNVILRVHNESLNVDFYNINDQKLDNYLKNRYDSSAFYEIYNRNDDMKQIHSKLGYEHYTHFTSPIRRAVDLFIHGLIIQTNDSKCNDYSSLLNNDLINKINIFTKNSRKFDRLCKRLDFLFNIKDLEKNIETYAYIISISKNKLTVYIPEYNLEEKIIIISKKFENIVNMEIIENSEKITTEINYEVDNKNKSYKLFEKINIKLWIFTTFENIFDKLKIEIIE